jgi:hypothetical protein
MSKLAAVTCSMFAILCTEPNLYAEQCECPGVQIAHYKGGDGAPLEWAFEAYKVEDGTADTPPLICFKRVVRNVSNLKALNIRWDVAGYRRRAIPGRDSNTSCPTLAALLTSTRVSGPLYHGVSSNQYDTTVHPPKDGWKQASASLPNWPLIRSVFQVDVNDTLFADIVLYSSVSTDDNKLYHLTYEVESRENATIRLLLNIQTVGPMDKDLPFIDDFILPPNSRKWFRSTVGTPVNIQPATAVISNVDTKEGLAVDVVGVYAPIEGKRRFSDQELYERVR